MFIFIVCALWRERLRDSSQAPCRWCYTQPCAAELPARNALHNIVYYTAQAGRCSDNGRYLVRILIGLPSLWPIFRDDTYSLWANAEVLNLPWNKPSHSPLKCSFVRGSFQKFCTLYIFSSKMDLFYKIHLQAFNVISIVLYHSGPTSGQVLYSCLDAFVVDASDYSGHLIRHLLNTSEAFPTEWFLQFWEQVKVWWAQPTTLWLVPKKSLRGKRFRSIEELSNEVTWVIRCINNEGVQIGIQDLPKRWTAVIKLNGDYIEGL
jgi:hypothetical protein